METDSIHGECLSPVAHTSFNQPAGLFMQLQYTSVYDSCLPLLSVVTDHPLLPLLSSPSPPSLPVCIYTSSFRLSFAFSFLSRGVSPLPSHQRDWFGRPGSPLPFPPFPPLLTWASLLRPPPLTQPVPVLCAAQPYTPAPFPTDTPLRSSRLRSSASTPLHL
jgi:hypothetical protein